MYQIVSNELYHHGIKGQKWGIRRFQNPDGTLTEAGKARYYTNGELNSKGKKVLSSTYKKLATKTTVNLSKNTNNLYAKAYNKAANEMNNGGIEAYNRDQEKKYGSNYSDRSEYYKEYEQMFNDLVQKYYAKSFKDIIDSDKSFQKATALVEKYNMYEWDSLAKDNSDLIKEINEMIQKTH